MAIISNSPINMTLICGGHGPVYVIEALLLLKKFFPNLVITCACPHSDGGGSTGELVGQGGSGSIGDVGSCIVALMGNKEMADRLSTRLEVGGFTGHSIKNLILWSLGLGFGIHKAIEFMSELCEIKPHQVLPVTEKSLKLYARMANGKLIKGEENIDTLSRSPLFDRTVHAITHVWLHPEANARACPRVIKAIRESHFIIDCPGSLWTTKKAVLAANGIKEAIRDSQSKIIMLANLTTQAGDTQGFTVRDFISKIEPDLGRSVDYVVVNNGPLNGDNWMGKIMEEAGRDNGLDFKFGLTKLGSFKRGSRKVVQADLLAVNAERGFHHDPEKTAEVLRKIIADNI